MKNPSRTVRPCVVVGLPLVAALVSGCGGGSPNTTPADLSPVTLTLSNLPTGCPSSQTASDLYTTVVANSCATANCHGSNGTSFQLTSATDLRDKLVGKSSKLYTGVTMPYVTASDVNKSWIMYKLTGSQGQFGSKMPLGGSLTNDQLCKFAAWISSGAL